MALARIVCGDSAELLQSFADDVFDSMVCDPPAGISFMGREWDQDHGGREGWVKAFAAIFSECLRVLKPGAHALVWALPRTSHWTATALEDAGFEIRDVVTHHFGTGFPKSMNVGKAIDKAAGADRKVVGKNPNHRAESGVSYEGVYAGGNTGSESITAPATPDAERWEGWGTALKPSSEHWILVRKPLGEKTVAGNVLKHGTGALNIDGCRIGTDSGRWPANLVLSHHPDCIQKGTKEVKSKCGGGDKKHVKGESTTGAYGDFSASNDPVSYGDENGMEQVEDWECVEGCPVREMEDQSQSARFFYQAKAASKEKFALCRDCDKVIPYKERKQHKDQGHELVFHPTQKGIEIMQYLCRLITSPGGIILDPFSGTGSTGVAAIQEGFEFLGVERDPEYVRIAEHRLKEVGVESV